MSLNLVHNLGSKDSSEKIWTPVFISLFIANALLIFSQQMSNALLAKYADHLGASSLTVGLVMSTFAITALGFKLFSAPAIDTFNRKYILAIFTAILGFSYLGYALSYSVSMLVVSRLLQGVGLAFTATCCLVLVADILPHDKLGTGIGYFSIGQAIAQSIAPALSLKLSIVIGYNLTFAFAGFLMFIAVFITMRIKVPFKKTKKFKISLESIIAKEALFPALLMFLLSLSYAAVGSFLILFGWKIGIGSDIGYFFTASAITLLFSRPIVGRLSDKYGPAKVLFPALICFACSFIIISYSTTLWMFLIAAVVSAFGFGVCLPVVQSLCMSLVPKERRGAGSCTSYIGNDTGVLLGPSLAGMLISVIGYTLMWRLMIIPILLAAVIVVIFRKKLILGTEKSCNIPSDIIEITPAAGCSKIDE